MIDNKFKRLMLECPHLVRDAVLNDIQVTAAKFVLDSDEPVHSSDVAQHLHISLSHASQIMKILTTKGYVRRLNTSGRAGEFEYRSTFEKYEAAHEESKLEPTQ